MRILWLLSLSFWVLGLQACIGSEQQDLNQWMTEQRAKAKPRVQAIEEPKAFKPEPYAGGAALDPFNGQKLIQALKTNPDKVPDDGLITPELRRAKEALESYPLDTMVVVGSLFKAGQQVALVQIDKLIYQVKVGNYLGQNYGRVTKVTENQITIREIVQDSGGDWVERPVTLQLQEKVL